MKKFTLFALTVLLLVGLCCGIGLSVAYAETNANGLERTILKDYALPEVPAGATAVNNAADLSAMSSVGIYYLTSDITVSSTYSAVFAGTLYGNGHTITLSGGVPIFNKLMGATVRDLTVAGTVSVSADYTGGLATTAYGSTLIGITNKASIHNSKSGKFGGGIVGYAENTTLQYCINYGVITGNSSSTRLGGLVGEMNNAEGTLTLENCINHGAVTGANQTGGLVSRVENGAALTIRNCANFGKVTVSVSDGGGIIGKITPITIDVTLENCYNSGRIEGRTYTGGFVGPMSGDIVVLKNCHNGCYVDGCVCDGSDHGKITNVGDNSVIGGLIGHFWTDNATVTITDCTNSGQVLAGSNSRTGGLAAVMETGTVTVKNCTNSGELQSTNYVGGLFARIGAHGTDGTGDTVTLENCTNTGSITTNSYGGGITGFHQYSAKLILINCRNQGNITTNWNAGGLIARMDDTKLVGTITLTDCTNSGTIKANGTAGGMTGILTGTFEKIKSLTLTNCVNTGNITAPNYAGGLSGIADVKSYSATNCRNSGNINIVEQGEWGVAGGLAGRVNGKGYFSHCTNTGNVIEVDPVKKGASPESEPKTIFDLYVGGIAGWVGQSGTLSEHKSQTATFTYCTNTGIIVARAALNKDHMISAGGIVGVSRSTCTAEFCINAGDVSGSCHVGGIAGLCSQNQQSGSNFTDCVVMGDLYNSGTKVTDRTHGVGGIVCYTWGDAFVEECTVIGDLQLDVSGSDLPKDQRRSLAALIGYTNNSNGMFRNNFFGGRLIGGEGTNCTKVMVANFVDHDVTSDEEVDIDNNYSVFEYTLWYCSAEEWSASKTPILTEEEIAADITMADKSIGGGVSLVKIVNCLGVEAPVHEFLAESCNSFMEGHLYTYDCEPICEICGRTKVRLVHTYDNACDFDCGVCGSVRETEHTYGIWVTTKAATETETGLKEHTCEVCGVVETAEVPVLEAPPPAEKEPLLNTTQIIIVAVAVGIIAVVVAVVLVKKKQGRKATAAEQSAPDADV